MPTSRYYNYLRKTFFVLPKVIKNSRAPTREYAYTRIREISAACEDRKTLTAQLKEFSAAAVVLTTGDSEGPYGTGIAGITGDTQLCSILETVVTRRENIFREWHRIDLHDTKTLNICRAKVRHWISELIVDTIVPLSTWVAKLQVRTEVQVTS
jgi:hypothetical protein